MSKLQRVLSSCLILILVLCVFFSSMSLSVSADSEKGYTFGMLGSSVVVRDGKAAYTVDIPFHRLYVFDQDLYGYRIDEGKMFTFYPEQTYKVALLSQSFLVSDFPVNDLKVDFRLSPSARGSNADLSYFTCNVEFLIQFRDSSGRCIGKVRSFPSFSNDLYHCSIIINPEDIPEGAVLFDFCIALNNFYVFTSAESSDYCFWLDKFTVTSTVERSGIFSRTVTLSSDLTGSLIDQFVFTDINYNCGPVYLNVDDAGFYVSCDDQTYRWNFDGRGVFSGIYSWIDGSPIYLEPGDSYVYYGTHLKLGCEIEYSFWDKIELAFENFFDSVAAFFSDNPFEGLLESMTNFRKNVGDWFDGLLTGIIDVFSSIPDLIEPVIAPIEDWIESVGDSISNLGKDISSFFGGLGDRIGNFFSSIPDLIEPVIAPIQGWISSIGDSISDLGSSIVESLGVPVWISDLFEIVSNNFIVDAFRDLWDWIVSVVDFFSIPVTYDSANLTFWDYLLGRTGEDGSFWDYQDDAGFISGISKFYSSVVDVWNAFPVPLRYLIMFGFCLPVSIGVLKSFLR